MILNYLSPRNNLKNILNRIRNPLSTKEWIGKEIDFNHPNLQSFFNSKNHIKGRIFDILLESGRLLTPPTRFFNTRSYFALARYYNAFSNSKKLSIINDYINVDSRIKSILSEEISIGISGHFLNNYVDVSHIKDFDGAKNKYGVKISNKHGMKKPDYLCHTKNNDLYIVETKGGLGPPCSVGGSSYSKNTSGDLKEGKKQVNNVKVQNSYSYNNIYRLVLGTNLCVEKINTRSKSTTHIVDPELDENPNFEINVEPEDIIINSYKKIMNLLGVHDILLSKRRKSNFYKRHINENFLEFNMDNNKKYAIIIDSNVLNNFIDIKNLEDIKRDLKREYIYKLNKSITESKNIYKDVYEDKKERENTYSFNNGIYFQIKHKGLK